MDNYPEHSHLFTRVFQADKIRPPRDFCAVNLEQHSENFLEIGAGKGKHALTFAQSHQNNVHLIAIERTKEKFLAFEKQYRLLDTESRRIENLTAIHADAIAWTIHALPPQSLDGVFILYPNPEPNNANQRWLNMPFFEFLLSRLKENATITLATNIESYVQEAKQQAEQVWKLDVELIDVPHDSERTHFEKKYLARGESCWQLNLTKPTDYTTRFDTFSHVSPVVSQTMDTI